MVPRGGVGDRHLVTIPQGVAGDRLSWGGEGQGGGEGRTPHSLVLKRAVLRSCRVCTVPVTESGGRGEGGSGVHPFPTSLHKR